MGKVYEASLVVLLFLSIFLGVSGSVPAGAATINVTADAPDDNTGGDGQCSLREAITSINNGSDFGDCTAIITPDGYGTNDNIVLPAGTYTNSISGAGEINNTTGDLNISRSVTITGAGRLSTFIDGGGIDRVLRVDVNITVNISGVTIRNGRITGSPGGGIALSNGTINITDSTVSGNYSDGHGGAIYNNDGTVTVTRSVITNNRADGNGGGIYTGANRDFFITDSTISDNSSGGNGGGAYFYLGNVVITGSTISGNSSEDQIGGGGGIYNDTDLTTVNTTISGNSASYGGGVWNQGSWTSINTTISDNTATSGGGLYNFMGITMQNTIVAASSGGGQSGGDCADSGQPYIFLTDNGNNLDSDGTCGWSQASSISGANPLLGPLADNGGLTFTHALLQGSPAIDNGNNSACSSSPVNGVDQRGITRPQGPDCDIGAFEATGVTAITVPTLNGWGAILLIAFLAVAALLCERTRQTERV